MSYDLNVWSAAKRALPDCLPAGRWSASGSSWTHGVRAWQVAVEEPVDVEEARKYATKTAGAIAKAARGAVVGGVPEALADPRGVPPLNT